MGFTTGSWTQRTKTSWPDTPWRIHQGRDKLDCPGKQFRSVIQSCLTLCDTMDCSMSLSLTSSLTNSQSLLKLMSIKSVMPSNHLILYSPLLLPPSVFPSIRVFSWQIDGETVETVTDFIFGTSKTTTDGDCSHEIKRWVLTGRKVMTSLDSILKRRDITLPTKVRLLSSVQFSRSVISDSF